MALFGASIVGTTVRTTEGRFPSMIVRASAILAAVAIGLAGCASTGDRGDGVGGRDEPLSLNRQDGPGHEFNFGRATARQAPAVEDPEYQQYLQWKRWQEFKRYQEWKARQQGGDEDGDESSS